MDWQYLGSRISLASYIIQATGINEDILIRGHLDRDTTRLPRINNIEKLGFVHCSYCTAIVQGNVQSILQKVCVAQKMKWASRRVTTREEDTAYALFVIFDVNMPLLYGEGTKAFLRLQEAIVSRTKDHSLLAFRAPRWTITKHEDVRLLAPHPSYFCDNIERDWMLDDEDGTMTFFEGRLTIKIILFCISKYPDWLKLFNPFPATHIGILDCCIKDDYMSRLAILLTAIDPTLKEGARFRRVVGEPMLLRLRDNDLGYFTMQDDSVDDVPHAADSKHQRSSLYYDPLSLWRGTITILTHAENGARHSLVHPLRLKDFKSLSTLQSHFTLGPSLPPSSPGCYPGIRKGSMGIISFYSSGFEHFFVIWGMSRKFASEEERVWCQIRTTTQMRNDFLLDIGPDVQGTDIVREVLRLMKPKIGSQNALWRAYQGKPDNSCQVVLGNDAEKLFVRIEIYEVKFIERMVYEMSATAWII